MEDKILKLTNAVYSLLEFFPQSDPLKNKAKEKALLVFEKQLSQDIDLLLGYLWIAKNQRWMSDANYLIIAGEYEKLKTKKAEVRPPPARPNLLEIDFQKRMAKAVKQVSKEASLKGRQAMPTGRQAKIMQFLQKKEKAQVMDLQTVLPDVTKRTIRRDLDELLGLGKIARFGDFNQVFYKLADRTKIGQNKVVGHLS